jgi:hypothetical protein
MHISELSSKSASSPLHLQVYGGGSRQESRNGCLPPAGVGGFEGVLAAVFAAKVRVGTSRW